MKNIALFDIDKTIFDSHSFFGVLDHFVTKGFTSLSTQDRVNRILEMYKKGDLVYSVAAHKLLKAWVTDLVGKTKTSAFDLSKEFFRSNKGHFYDYFINIIENIKKHYDVYLVTTNTQFVANAVVDMFGLKDSISTIFETKKDLFTGNIIQDLSQGKSVVKRILDKYPNKTSVAFGDSGNDIEMLSAVSRAFCFEPNDDLLKIAKRNDWLIINKNNAEKIIIANLL